MTYLAFASLTHDLLVIYQRSLGLLDDVQELGLIFKNTLLCQNEVSSKIQSFGHEAESICKVHVIHISLAWTMITSNHPCYDPTVGIAKHRVARKAIDGREERRVEQSSAHTYNERA